MGAYRDRAQALGVEIYYTCDASEYSSGAGMTYTYSGPPGATLYTGAALYEGLADRSLVKTEAGKSINSGLSWGSAHKHLSMANIISQYPDFAEASAVFTGVWETGVSKPPHVATRTVGKGGEFGSSYGFIRGTLYRQPAEGEEPGTTVSYWWDLHETNNGTIGIATYSEWGDEGVLYPNYQYPSWGVPRVYIYDTGIPVLALMDGRPHLVSIRLRGQSQYNATWTVDENGTVWSSGTNTPLAQDNWIKLDIDGQHHYTSSRGPGFVNSGSAARLEIAGEGLDEIGFWDRQLTNAEVASFWSPAIWGPDDWPHPGAGLATFTSHAETTEGLLRIVDWEKNWNGGPRLPQVLDFAVKGSDIDPVWDQHWPEGVATGVGILARADMGAGTWEGVDPWSSARTERQADKWLTDQDIVLIGGAVAGTSSAMAELGVEEDRPAGTASGHSSASGELTLHIPLAVEPIHGSSYAYAITIGDLEQIAATSSGSSSVSGELVVGMTEELVASAAGSSSVADATLSVKPYTRIGGGEVDDQGRPMTIGGLRRAHFSPKSVGRVDERPNSELVSQT